MITEMVSFFVPGHPRTKGSLDVVAAARPGKRAVVRESARDSGLWRRLVADCARRAMAGRPAATGGVIVYMRAAFMADDVLSAHIGDQDKLERNLLDAMEDAGVYLNDRQVVMLVTDKGADTSGVQGMFVRVYRLPESVPFARDVAENIAQDLAAVLKRWTVE